jgi:membrane protein implicated in regulation of membrane protease activity
MLKVLKTAGRWGSIFLLIALLIALVRQLIAFIGFMTTVIKILIVLAFVAVFLFVGYLFFKAMMEKQRKKEPESD